jgi:hypothetical protein
MLERLARDVVRLAAMLDRLEHSVLVNTPGRRRVKRAEARRARRFSRDERNQESRGTDLKRLMRSNMSSWDTSGYLRCSLIACIVENGNGGE